MLRYDSGIAASTLIAQIKDEADISYPIPDSSYYRFLNEVLQSLYGDVIDDFRVVSLEPSEYGTIKLSDIAAPVGCMAVKYDDIVKIYVDGIELIEVGDIGAQVFERDMYCDNHDGTVSYRMALSSDIPENITLIYRARPSLFTADDNTANVCLPYEYLSLAMAYIRGEAYKLANEDVLAAKWLSDFNAQLEDFKAWCAVRNARYGE